MNRSDWTPGDENVARLLGTNRNPPAVPAEFAARVQARLLEVAAEMARQRASAPRRSNYRPRLAALAGVAALLSVVALGLRFMPAPPEPLSPRHLAEIDRKTVAAPPPAPARGDVLSPGWTLATRAGERRRIALADGSVLSLNQNTLIHFDAPRRLTLKAGEIFVEVAPRLAEKAASPFIVAAPHRDIRAIGTKFLVSADASGTGVAVTQGQVHVSDCDGLLRAGQQLAPKASVATPAPRMSYLLDWTRNLVAAAAPPLVPPSAYAGGALVAVDPQGRAASLSLRKYHIDVHIEDGFARTTIDQTYFNHTLRRLEGTFYFPLPTDASLSRLAMYVDGQLMEGGMVERDYGRAVFEQIVTKMKDPALLEWVDGHTFKMRVFPLEARQEKRIILSYTQRLANLYGRLSYRFPAGHSLGAVRDWSFHARVKDGAKRDWSCDSHVLTPRIENGDLLLDANAHQATMERDLVFTLVGQASQPDTLVGQASQPDTLVGQAFQPDTLVGQAFQPDTLVGQASQPDTLVGQASQPDRQAGKPDLQRDVVRFSTVTQDGFRYLMLRYRPDLPAVPPRQRRDWVFLFESSADRDPLLARTQIEVIRTILNNAEYNDTFAVLTVDTRVQRFAAAPQRATPENVAAALAFLDRTHLLGALDLDAGLTAAADLLRNSEHPILVHCGSGQAILGERRPEILTARIPAGACYVGVPVGKRWARNFMQRAAEQCQGYVTPINPDEPVAWRAFDLLATLNTPRLLNVHATDPAGKAKFLCPSSTLAQGEELCTIARLPIGAPLPKSLHINGTLDGRPFERELPVESPRSGASYLPRTWARLEIDRLLAEDAAKNKDAIVALSKAMYVMTPYTSLLVLENEAMYAKYKVDRGRKDHWAIYPCPPRIPVVYEQPSPNEMRAFAPAIDWAVRFDPITGQPINPLLDPADGLDQENNNLGFFPPSMALTVRATATIHNRASSLIVPPGLVNANAQYQRTIEQAKLVRENSSRSAFRTRRSWIEEADYERAHMPAPEKLRQEQLARELDRARSSPPLTEIWSGRSLNSLLSHLIARQKQGVRGLDVSLSEDTLKSLNLTAGDIRGNVSLLKDGGKLRWPQSLRGAAFKEAREDFGNQMVRAVKTAQFNKNPDESTINEMQADLRKLYETLDDRVGEMPLDQSIEARRYLRLLGDTVTALKDRNVFSVLNGKWKANSRTVGGLVKFMAENGLWFAPATLTDRSAYLDLYHMLAAFDDFMEVVRPPMFQLEPEGSVPLLADPAQAQHPSRWRQAARAAEQKKQYDLARQHLEHALAIEAKQPHTLAALRRDYAWLLSLAHKRVKELTSRSQPVPRDLLDRVMAHADRWRAVDPLDWIPCYLAACILRLAGERELAWSYLTTPAATHEMTAAGWLEVARQQHWQNDCDLAERAFAIAESLEPANAEIVWERALNHRAAGRVEAARALFARLDKGVWEDRYKALQIRARAALKTIRD